MTLPSSYVTDGYRSLNVLSLPVLKAYTTFLIILLLCTIARKGVCRVKWMESKQEDVVGSWLLLSTLLHVRVLPLLRLTNLLTSSYLFIWSIKLCLVFIPTLQLNIMEQRDIILLEKPLNCFISPLTDLVEKLWITHLISSYSVLLFNLHPPPSKLFKR